jgi:hypothetical protein
MPCSQVVTAEKAYHNKAHLEVMFFDKSLFVRTVLWIRSSICVLPKKLDKTPDPISPFQYPPQTYESHAQHACMLNAKTQGKLNAERERRHPVVCILEKQCSWEPPLRVQLTPLLIVQEPVYEMSRTNHRGPVLGLYYIEYILTLEDHPALALQERTGHLGDFAGLD